MAPGERIGSPDDEKPFLILELEKPGNKGKFIVVLLLENRLENVEKIGIPPFVLLASVGAVFLSGLEVCTCCPVFDNWHIAAGQGLIVCRT